MIKVVMRDKTELYFVDWTINRDTGNMGFLSDRGVWVALTTADVIEVHKGQHRFAVAAE